MFQTASAKAFASQDVDKTRRPVWQRFCHRTYQREVMGKFYR